MSIRSEISARRVGMSCCRHFDGIEVARRSDVILCRCGGKAGCTACLPTLSLCIAASHTSEPLVKWPVSAQRRCGRAVGSIALLPASPVPLSKPIGFRAQCCSRVALKRISGHSSVVVRRSQALRARKTGAPSWSSASADELRARKRSSSARSPSSQRAAS